MGSPSNQSWCGLEWGFMKFQQSGHSWRNNSDIGCDSLRMAEGWHRLWPFFIFESSVLIFGGECIWTIHKGRVLIEDEKTRKSTKWEWFLSSTYPLCVLERSTNRNLSFKDMPWHSGIQSQLESYGVIKFPGQKQGPSEVWNLVTFETSFLVSILPWLQVPLAAGDSFVLGCVPRLGNVFFVNNGVVQYVSICKDYKTWESLWSRFGVNPLNLHFVGKSSK